MQYTCNVYQEVGKESVKIENGRLTRVSRSWPSSGPTVWTGSRRPGCSWPGRWKWTRSLPGEEVCRGGRAPPRPFGSASRPAGSGGSSRVHPRPSAAAPALEGERRPGRRRATTKVHRRSPTGSARPSPSPCTRYGGSSRSREGGNDTCSARTCAKSDPSSSRSVRSAMHVRSTTAPGSKGGRKGGGGKGRSFSFLLLLLANNTTGRRDRWGFDSVMKIKING